VVAGGSEDQAIAAAARRSGVMVAMGVAERDGGSLYMGQWLYGADGSVLARRRKLKPTHVERTLFGEGDGSDVQVVATPLGRVGSLCCWEHLQPLTKYAMYAQHEQIHIAAWPSFSLYVGAAYALGPEVNTAASQLYAAEGQCFVVASCAVVSAAMVELMCDTPAKRELLKVGGARARCGRSGGGGYQPRHDYLCQIRSRSGRALLASRCHAPDVQSAGHTPRGAI
jgi:aliphatic nitrilase